MSEKMRGALFNALGDISGLSILDAFGGSGALSFEAVSRGAASSIIVEVYAGAHRTIKENIAALGLDDQVKATRANISGWSNNNPDRRFDLVLCNPPFDALKLSLIEKLTKHVKPGGLLVLSWPSGDKAPSIQGLTLEAVKEKDYGDAQLVFYRKTG